MKTKNNKDNERGLEKDCLGGVPPLKGREELPFAGVVSSSRVEAKRPPLPFSSRMLMVSAPLSARGNVGCSRCRHPDFQSKQLGVGKAQTLWVYSCLVAKCCHLLGRAQRPWYLLLKRQSHSWLAPSAFKK